MYWACNSAQKFFTEALEPSVSASAGLHQFQHTELQCQTDVCSLLKRIDLLTFSFQPSQNLLNRVTAKQKSEENPAQVKTYYHCCYYNTAKQKMQAFFEKKVAQNFLTFLGFFVYFAPYKNPIKFYCFNVLKREFGVLTL